MATLLSTSFAAQSSVNNLEDAWDFADLYDNEQGNCLESSSRLQLESTWVDSDQGNFEETLWRRLYFSFKDRYGEFKCSLEADLNVNNTLDNANIS